MCFPSHYCRVHLPKTNALEIPCSVLSKIFPLDSFESRELHPKRGARSHAMLHRPKKGPHCP